LSDAGNVGFRSLSQKISLSRERPDGEYAPANVTRGMVEDVVYLGDMSVFQVVLESGKRLRVTKANSLRGDPDAIRWDEEVFASWGAAAGSVLTS